MEERDTEQFVRDRLYGGVRNVTATPLRPGVRALLGGRYRLLERIGAGGMADMYRARDERLKREVAVKVIADWLVDDPPVVRRFRREAELGARLSHANVVAVLDAGIRPREHIVMELVDGLNAHSLLSDGAQLEPNQAVGVLGL